MSEEDPLLSDNPSPKKKGKKKAAKKKAAAPKKAKSSVGMGLGRPPSDETLENRRKVLQYAKAKNGVSNVDLAEKLGVSTAQSQTVCRALVAVGKLKARKDSDSGRVTYFTV